MLFSYARFYKKQCVPAVSARPVFPLLRPAALNRLFDFGRFLFTEMLSDFCVIEALPHPFCGALKMLLPSSISARPAPKPSAVSVSPASIPPVPAHVPVLPALLAPRNPPLLSFASARFPPPPASVADFLYSPKVCSASTSNRRTSPSP